MSSGDRKLAYGIAKSATDKASEIKTILEIENNEYTPYRDRLVKRGILDFGTYYQKVFPLIVLADGGDLKMLKSIF